MGEIGDTLLFPSRRSTLVVAPTHSSHSTQSQKPVTLELLYCCNQSTTRSIMNSLSCGVLSLFVLQSARPNDRTRLSRNSMAANAILRAIRVLTFHSPLSQHCPTSAPSHGCSQPTTTLRPVYLVQIKADTTGSRSMLVQYSDGQEAGMLVRYSF